MNRCSLLALLGTLTACGLEAPGPENIEIAVVDAPAALTSGAGDTLFTLTVKETAKSFVLADISVDVAVPGQTPFAVNFTHQDPDGDGQLDQGETLTCTEPPLNLLDPSVVGKALTVNFAERVDGTFFQIGNATWTPGN